MYSQTKEKPYSETVPNLARQDVETNASGFQDFRCEVDTNSASSINPQPSRAHCVSHSSLGLGLVDVSVVKDPVLY